MWTVWSKHMATKVLLLEHHSSSFTEVPASRILKIYSFQFFCYAHRVHVSIPKDMLSIFYSKFCSLYVKLNLFPCWAFSWRVFEVCQVSKFTFRWIPACHAVIIANKLKKTTITDRQAAAFARESYIFMCNACGPSNGIARRYNTQEVAEVSLTTESMRLQRNSGSISCNACDACWPPQHCGRAFKHAACNEFASRISITQDYSTLASSSLSTLCGAASCCNSRRVSFLHILSPPSERLSHLSTASWPLTAQPVGHTDRMENRPSRLSLLTDRS